MSLQLRKKLRSRFLLSAVPMALVAVIAASNAAYAIETVTVTAEKRSENVQNVPIAITAFTGAQLEDKGVTTLTGLSSLTPNVTLDAGTPFGGDSSVLSASIRGIGSDDFAFNIDPAVGVYVDGIYYARTIGANVDLLDVERIEIAKGPQGTLFGRNTIGGAISIVTRDPGDRFMFKAMVTTGSFNRRDINATADIPLTDHLRSSITIQSVQRDGYQKVVPFDNSAGYYWDPPTTLNGGTDQHDAYGGQNRQSVRGKLVWDATSHFKATLTADWTHEDQEAQPVTVRQTFPNTPAFYDSIAMLYTLCTAGIPIGQLCSLPRADGFPSSGGLLPLDTPGINWLPISPATTQTGNIDTTYASGPNFAKFDSAGVGLTLDYQLTDNVSLKSITGYRDILWNIGTNLDGSPGNGSFLNVTDKQHQRQFSEEVQALGTAFDGRLNWVAGIFYFYEDGYVHDWVPFDGSLLAVDDLGLNNLRTNSYAGYVHADYKLTDSIGITLGGRYSVEQKEFLGGQQDYNGLSYKVTGCYPPGADASIAFGGPPVFLPPGVATCQQFLGFTTPGQPFRYFPAGWNKRNFYEFTPTAGAQWHITDDKMLYFRWAKGFKSGGWTTRLSDPIANGKDAQYSPEKAETYEVGLKSQWFNHRLQLNTAFFYTDFRDIQLNQQVAASPVLKNLGTARIYGAELEGQADLGRGFLLKANVGYLDAAYTSLDPSVVAVDSLGFVIPQSTITLNSKLPKTPKWKININPQYYRDLGNGRALQVQVSYTHTSSMYNDTLNTELLKRQATDTFDASVQVSFDNDKYAVTVGGTNITDQRFITIGSVNYAAGFVDATYNPPAEWYLSLRVKD
jgi:iron complex outermembrane receptor protein